MIINQNMGASSSNEQTPKYDYTNYKKRHPSINNYIIDKDEVYLRGVKVHEADGKTFVDYNNGYGMDTNYIFYKGRNICTSSKFFTQLDNGYAKTNKIVYFQGYIIDADPVTFIKSCKKESEKEGEKECVYKDKNYKYINGVRNGRISRKRSRK